MNETIKVGLRFGLTVPPLVKQLRAAKVPVPKNIKLVQAQADAIALLRISGALTSAEGHKARMRLVKQLTRALVEESK